MQLTCSRALRLRDNVRTKSQDARREKVRTLKHIETPIRVSWSGSKFKERVRNIENLSTHLVQKKSERGDRRTVLKEA